MALEVGRRIDRVDILLLDASNRDELVLHGLVLIPDHEVRILQLHFVIVQLNFLAYVLAREQLLIEDQVVQGADRVISELSFVDEGVCDVAKHYVGVEKILHLELAGASGVPIALVLVQNFLIAF